MMQVYLWTWDDVLGKFSKFYGIHVLYIFYVQYRVRHRYAIGKRVCQDFKPFVWSLCCVWYLAT